MKSPTAHRATHLRRGIVADRRSKAHKEFAPLIPRPSRTKRIAEKVKLLDIVLPSSVLVLAIDELRLLWMQLQLALGEPLLDAPQNCFSLLLRSAVRYRIICVSLEWNDWMRSPHPVIKRQVQKDVGQQGTRDPTLGCSLCACYQFPICRLQRRF
jgi:hypothetical protein